jgi:hypothetical protein
MAAGHDDCCVPDAGCGVDGGWVGGHQVLDPDFVEVFPVRDRVGDVCPGDDAGGLAGLGVQDHQSSCARVFHQVGSGGGVAGLFYRRQWWPHEAGDGGLAGWWLGGLPGGSFCHVLLHRDLVTDGVIRPAMETIWSRRAHTWP